LDMDFLLNRMLQLIFSMIIQLIWFRYSFPVYAPNVNFILRILLGATYRLLLVVRIRMLFELNHFPFSTCCNSQDSAYWYTLCSRSKGFFNSILGCWKNLRAISRAFVHWFFVGAFEEPFWRNFLLSFRKRHYFPSLFSVSEFISDFMAVFHLALSGLNVPALHDVGWRLKTALPKKSL
jgi:hypothetical protein